MPNPIYNYFFRLYHRRYHGVYYHAKKLFVFDLILLAIALAMLGGGLFFFFWQPNFNDKIDLAFTLDNSHALSGELMPLGITYQNRNQYALENTVLSVQLPDGFEIDRTKTPESEFSPQSTFNLDTVQPGAKGQKIIWGYFWSTPKKDTKISAILSYKKPDNKNRIQKLSTFNTNLLGSIIETIITYPTSTVAGQTIPIIIKITNRSDRELKNVDLIGNEYFSKITHGGDWRNLTLAPKSEQAFEGSLVALAQPPALNLTVGTSIQANSIFNIDQGQTEAKIGIVTVPNFNLNANWSNTAAYVEPGEMMPVKIHWKNSGDKTLSAARLRLSFSPNVIDLKTTAKNNRLKIEGNELIADKTVRTTLATIKPGDEDEWIIELTLLPVLNLGEQEKVNFTVLPILEGSLENIVGQTIKLPGNTASVPLSTELNLQAQTRYFTPDGDQLGRGALPPTVGQTTKYWIFVQISNTTNLVKDCQFSANLPDGAKFTGKQSVTIGSPIKYNDTAKTISWNQDRLPANSITGLYFEVAVTPGFQSIGQSLPLLKNIQLTANDGWTGKQFSLTAPNLNNTLSDDDLGAEMGYKVVAE